MSHETPTTCQTFGALWRRVAHDSRGGSENLFWAKIFRLGFPTMKFESHMIKNKNFSKTQILNDVCYKPAHVIDRLVSR